MDRFEVKMHNGSPALFMNDQPIFPAIYLTNKNLRTDEAGWVDDVYFKDFTKAGFQLYSISIEHSLSFDKTYDPSSGEFPEDSFSRLEELKNYIKINPDAKFLLRVGTEPRDHGGDSPWFRQHMDQREIIGVDNPNLHKSPSYASKIWIRDAKKYLNALIKSIYSFDLQNNILGYVICAGDSAEWVRYGAMENIADDYSPPMQDAFRQWLRKKYNNDEKLLREIWNDPNVSFEQDLVPSPEEQDSADLFLFKDPRKRRKVIDYFECFSDIVADDIDQLCGTAKDACGRNHIAGVFYGYLQELVWSNGFFAQGPPDCDVDHTALSRSGHAGLKKVLQSKNVDFLSSPYSYGFRGVGGEGGFMSPYETVRRAGKLWISEEDIRTHRWPEKSYYGQTRNVNETCQVIKRQMSNIIIHSAGSWWCDWAGDKRGAFCDPEVMQLFKRFLEIGQHSLSLPERSSAAETAIVIDEESYFYRSTINNFDIPNWRNRTWGIARMGAPVDFILLNDLLEGRAKEYKFYYMMNTFHLSKEQRESLKNILRRNGKVTLWVYASGFVDDEDISVDYCSDVTGINLEMTNRQWGANIYINNFEHRITRNLPTSTFWGTDNHLGPLFTVNDDNVITLGNVVISQGRCEPGFVIREEEDWASVYSAAPNLSPAVLRELARYANVHIYSEDEDVLYANNSYVMIHTVRSGVKKIALPHSANVWEVFSNRLLGRNCTSFEDVMKSGDTNLYYYGSYERP